MRMRGLIEDMSRLETELHRFETRFGVKSQDFYDAMAQDELEEFDALDEYRMEFIEWLALYKTRLSLDKKYRQLIAREPVALQIKTNLGLPHTWSASFFTPSHGCGIPPTGCQVGEIVLE